ncbi:Uncharacterised protein [Mycobacterium tuberculosis]|nr:Uncharacterised protein [Mycobacterium tuberculosis]
MISSGSSSGSQLWGVANRRTTWLLHTASTPSSDGSCSSVIASRWSFEV